MTPKAKQFKAANDRSKVISGYAIEPNPEKPAKGGVYRLANGQSFRLNVEDMQSLPEDYPKWKL